MRFIIRVTSVSVNGHVGELSPMERFDLGTFSKICTFPHESHASHVTRKVNMVDVNLVIRYQSINVIEVLKKVFTILPSLRVE